MQTIDVLVAATPPDVEAEGVRAAIAARGDMTLVEGRVLPVSEVDAHLASIPEAARCALVLVGPNGQTERLAARWVAERAGLVVLRVDVPAHAVHLSVRDITLDLESLLSTLRVLIERAGAAPGERVAQVQLRAVPTRGESIACAGESARPLLRAAIEWLHVLLRDGLPHSSAGDLPGLTLTAATVADLLDAHPPQAPVPMSAAATKADLALTRALASAHGSDEPLAALRRALGLTPLEFRVLILAWAPELDIRYQRCIGLLLDDLGRRVGTLALYATLLGEPSRVRGELARTANLAHWRLLDARFAATPAADEPLRLDAPIAAWLMGERAALELDPRVRRVLRTVAWPGADLFVRPVDHIRATSFVTKLQMHGDAQAVVLAGADAAGWRALLELGARLRHTDPVRIEASRLAGLDAAEIEESGARLGRLARLTARSLLLDATVADSSAQDDDALRVLLAALAATGARVGMIATDTTRVVRLLGPTPYALVDGTALHGAARAANLRAAAKALDVSMDESAAAEIAARYPLAADAIEHALRLARSRGLPTDDERRRRMRLLAACQDVAAEGASRLAERIDPMFRLEDVVVPGDRMSQLEEIADSMRLAAVVLDGWKFREQLPYGRGVTALLHGPSGTGKTMAAIGIAHRLGIQILRLDLARVVSKYIGDTEKNIDRVFVDAQHSGAAILIDEADALFGRRSEVKDAHDRYANIEVAFLLQRMEAFDGLAILTTNLRQNLDPAFLRRLRFIIDFPRPDVDAREKIWRRCLPDGSHALDDAAFRQLARRIELTGGNIRQITLRAAFVAAASGSLIGLAHIDYAARAEFAKLGIPPVALDVAPQRQAA